jgi:hypothetical protein
MITTVFNWFRGNPTQVEDTTPQLSQSSFTSSFGDWKSVRERQFSGMDDSFTDDAFNSEEGDLAYEGVSDPKSFSIPFIRFNPS